MATGLSLINSVLRRLRKDTITSLGATDKYSNLILDLVNETKREVEDAWNWLSLRQQITVATSDGVSNYTLTGAGQRCRILAAYNETGENEIVPVPHIWLDRQMILTTPTSGDVCYYRVRGSSGGDPKIDVLNVPNSVQTLKFECVVPQADLASTDTLTLPHELPIVLGAWARAISERGEDGGSNTSEQWQMYQNALSDAIAIDAGKVSDELIWEVC